MPHHPRTETKIRDDDPSTEGGPPGWMAFTAVAVLFLFIAAVVMTLVAIMS